MNKSNIKKLLKKLPNDTILVIKANDQCYTSWPIDIKYTSEGIWMVVFDVSKAILDSKD